MRVHALVAACALALSGTAGAGEFKSNSCHVRSNYELSLQGDRMEFAEREGGKVLVIADGQLIIARAHARLSTEDQRRLRAIEAELRALLPEAREIALAALDIAFTALGEVSEMLAPDEDTREQLAQARLRLTAALKARPNQLVDGEDVGRVVGEAVGEVVPSLVGSVVSMALKAAFTGDTEAAKRLEARAEQLEKDIERRIEPRAKALERRAEALCDRVEHVDSLEAELEYRLPDGRRLDLVEIGPE